MIKILINLSNISVGGGLQVSTSFIRDLPNFENKYTIRLIVNTQQYSFCNNMTHIDVIQYEEKKGRDFSKRKYVGFLKEQEKSFKPDIVFTLFGPGFWRPKVKHVIGYAVPHYIYKDLPFKKAYGKASQIKILLKEALDIFLFKKMSDYYVVETNDVKSRLAKRLKISSEKIFVVSNTYSNIFDSPELWKNDFTIRQNKKEFVLITITANYPHKNLSVIPAVIDVLIDNNRLTDFTFVLTIPKNNFKYNLSEKHLKHIKFIGKVGISQCPDLYRQSNALFLPTLLECFSASYLEAMKMAVPILTSDYSFATSICGDAAVYFDPLNMVDIAQKIEAIALNPELYQCMVEKSKNAIEKFPKSLERTATYFDILSKLI